MPTAFGTPDVGASVKSPCQTDNGQSAASPIPYTPQQPLSTFGENPPTDPDPTWGLTSLHGYGTTPIITYPDTPGVVSAPGGAGSFGTVTMNRTYPSVSVSGAYVGSTSGINDVGTLNYYFEVVPDSGSASPSPVTIGVTAKGGVSVTTSGGGSGELNDADVYAKLNINAGSGSNVLTELAQAYYGYYSINGCVQCYNYNTSNVTGTLGPTSTFSGGFNINDLQITIDTDTVYDVNLTASLVGGPNLSASAFVDPFLIIPPGYELELSPGILNGIATVPEPSTWAMLLVGFAGLSLAGFRASRRAAGTVA